MVHAGAGHTDHNLRLHFYFDPKDKNNITWRKRNTFYFTDEIKWYDYCLYYKQRRLNQKNLQLRTSEKKKRIREHVMTMNARKFSAKGRAIEDAVREEAEPVLCIVS